MWLKLGRDVRVLETADAYEFRRPRPEEYPLSPPKLGGPCGKGFVMVVRGRELPGGGEGAGCGGRRSRDGSPGTSAALPGTWSWSCWTGGTGSPKDDRRMVGSVGWWTLEIRVDDSPARAVAVTRDGGFRWSLRTGSSRCRASVCRFAMS